MHLMTEDLIIKGCVDNNAAAQQQLYDMYSPKMLAICYRYAKNRDDAEDMLQEGFIKIFTLLKQFRSEGSLEGWMKRTMVHCCINILKKNKRFNESVDLAQAQSIRSTIDEAPAVLQAKQIIDCIRLLPIGYRTVLNLYAIEGYAHKEIAILLDIEESTSRSQYTRAKTMLQNLLVKSKILRAADTSAVYLSANYKK
jgi:RNA polymerase sigma factor (sigma-70 family)